MVLRGGGGGTPANNEIWYTSTDGKIIAPYKTDGFGATITSNTYANGKGVIKFNGDVTAIPSNGFLRKTTLATIIIPAKATSIGANAFRECTALTSATLPEGLTSIGSGAFHQCSKLSVINLPTGLTIINTYTFYATGLTSITVPEGVTSIDGYAFTYCPLTEVSLPNSLKTIGQRAFMGCNKCNTFEIPKNVTSIGKNAFTGLNDRVKIYCYPIEPPTGSESMFDDNNSTMFIYVPTASVDEYKAAEYWSDYANVIYGRNM